MWELTELVIKSMSLLIQVQNSRFAWAVQENKNEKKMVYLSTVEDEGMTSSVLSVEAK